MADQPNSPVLAQPIPPQVVNEGAPFGPLILTNYIRSPNEISGALRFSASISSDLPLPTGLICTTDGTISGIPAKGTEGTYEITITVENDAPEPFITILPLTIKKGMIIETGEPLNVLKTKVWDALKKNLPLPEMGDILNRPITAIELYYLLQRFAVLTIWDVYNLDMPGKKVLLNLPDASPHYNIYDRGSCLVGAPKDLFSYERTLEDALQTSRAMAREVYKRNWTIELSGFNKMIRGAWVELQLLGDKHGKHLDVLHFNPTPDDIRVYTEQSKAKAQQGM